MLCKQKEKHIQTFDEAHISQVLSLIDESQQWREGEVDGKNEKGRKMHSRHLVWSKDMTPVMENIYFLSYYKIALFFLQV